MPVSTRSQIKTTSDENNSRQDMGMSHRNPHHGLKEKMKALTLLYEQQKRETLAKNNRTSVPRFTSHPSIDLGNNSREKDKEKEKSVTKTRTYVLPNPEFKENVNVGVDKIIGFACSRKGEVARKLSMGGRNEQESEKVRLLKRNDVFGNGSRSEQELGKNRFLEKNGFFGTRNEQELEKVENVQVLEKNGVYGNGTRNEQELERNRVCEKNGVFGNGTRNVQDLEKNGVFGIGTTRTVQDLEKNGVFCIGTTRTVQDLEKNGVFGIGTTRTVQDLEKNCVFGNGTRNVQDLEKNGGSSNWTRNVQDLEKVQVLEKNCVFGNGNRIMVYVRLRPMAKKERDGGSRCCVRIVNRRDVYLTEIATENDYLRLKRLRGRHFTFDASFMDTATQQEVYSTTTAELVESVLQGRNGSVFCYGATGAGKTYTMLGTMENPGVMVLAIKDLFNKIRQRSCDGNHVVHLSYLEVYNETVRDLISPGRPLVLREDKQGITASGLTQYRAYTTDEVMALLQQGNKNRTTEPTRANETSSRSHAILQVAIEYRAKDASDNVVNRIGKLSLIDLAGSERALATDQRTLRSLEGANINRSLLALSSCINALVEGKKHIPYRNSKLTQLLKDSLGGACNTVMIANISPNNLSFGETQNTLHWADRAKEIRTKASEVNEEALQVPDSETDQAKLLLELQKENRDLRVQLARQQQKLITVQAQSLATNASPAPSTLSSLLTPPSSSQANQKRKTRSSFLSGNCFTPESKKRGNEMVKELKQTVKDLEAEMQRMRKDHLLLMKQKDEMIRDLSTKIEKQEVPKKKVVVTRASLRPKTKPEDELRSPSQRFLSPAPAAKKRSFWDITAANSPSVAIVNGRKTRSHVTSEPAAAPSKLLQPGFARQRI